MLRKLFLGLIIFAAHGCQTAEPKPVPAQIIKFNVPYVVLKSTWKYCYDLCGKKDQLAAVSQHGCICSNGGTIPFQATAPELPESVKNESAPPVTKSVSDIVTEYLKGNQ